MVQIAWSTPLTAVANTALTAAQWNASVRDNLLETVPAKATAAGRIFVSTGANAIAERRIVFDTVATGQTTASTTYTALTTAGPTVASITTGALAIVSITSQVNNTTDGASARHGFDVSGATTIAANDPQSALIQATSSRDCSQTRTMLVTLTAGNNTFTSKYRVSSGTGRWQDRDIVVIAL